MQRFALTTVAALLSAGVMAQPVLRADLSLVRGHAGSAQAVEVSLKLRNDGSSAGRVLNWFGAGELEENVFEVLRDGQPVEFIGAHYKRPAPASKDFTPIASKRAIVRKINLTNLYDMSKSGSYSIRFKADMADLSADRTAKGDVASNTVKMTVEGRETAALSEYKAATTESQYNANALVASVSYSKCTTTQQTGVNAGYSAASSMANNATSYLSGSASGTPRYTTWFGAFSTTNWNTAKTHFIAIKDALDSKPLVFDCACKKTYYAYVYPTQPYKIYLCKAYWTAPTTGTDSKGGTIVHELSHFNAVAGTDDHVYGQTGAKNLALTNPTQALDNADSHEYFAENTPAQN